MPPQQLFLRAWPAARTPSPPPSPSLSQPPQQQQQSQRNNGAPSAAASSGNGREARLSYPYPDRGTPDGRGGRGGGPGPGNGAAGGRGAGASGRWHGPRCSAGPTGGNSGVGTTSASLIHACRRHRTACPNLVRYCRISFSVRAPGQSHCPRYPNPFIPTSPPTHSTRSVACLHSNRQTTE